MHKKLNPQTALPKAKNIHNRHIQRLQDRNKALADALADERILRQNAYTYYHKRLNSRIMSFFDMYFAFLWSAYSKR